MLFIKNKLKNLKLFFTNITTTSRWYYKLTFELRMFYGRITSPHATLMFIVLFTINFISFIVYIPLLYLCSIYWILKTVHYSTDFSVSELKPYGDFDHTPEGASLYVVCKFYIIGHTFQKAYLNSFSMVYKLLNFWKGERITSQSKSYWNLVFRWSYLVLRALFWFIIRVITSLPRVVIVDSYRGSSAFISSSWIGLFRKIFIKKNISLEAQLRWIRNRWSTCVMMDLYDVTMPITYMRIFKTPSNKYNFNPFFTDPIFIKESGSKLVKCFGKIDPLWLGKLQGPINSNMFVRCYAKSPDKSIFHRTLTLRLTNQYRVRDFYDSSKFTFTKDNPNPLLALNQTSQLNPKNVSKSHQLVNILRAREGILKPNPTQSILWVPNEGFETRAEIPKSVDENLLIPARTFWEQSGLDINDFVTGIILHPKLSLSVTTTLEESSITINTDYKNFLSTLTNKQFQGEVQSLSEDELRRLGHLVGYLLHGDSYLLWLNTTMKDLNYYGVSKYTQSLPSDTDSLQF